MCRPTRSDNKNYTCVRSGRCADHKETINRGKLGVSNFSSITTKLASRNQIRSVRIHNSFGGGCVEYSMFLVFSFRISRELETSIAAVAPLFIMSKRGWKAVSISTKRPLIKRKNLIKKSRPPSKKKTRKFPQSKSTRREDWVESELNHN